MDKLKPCPFCGSEAKLESWMKYAEYEYKYEYKYECSDPCCQASYMMGAFFDSELEAREAWNRRADNE